MDFLVVAGLIALMGFLLYLYGTATFGYWKKKGVPSEPAIPFFGNLLDVMMLKKNPGQVASDIYEKHADSPVVGMFNFRTPALLVRDPTLVQQVLVTDFNNFPHNEIDIDEKVDPVMAGNIFCSRGNLWKRRRQMLSPAFTAGKVKSSYVKILECADRLAAYIEGNPGEVQAKDLMALYTSEVVAGWGLGIDGHSFTEKNPVLIRLGKLVFEPSTTTAIVQIINFLFPFVSRVFKVKFTPDEVPNFFRSVVTDILSHRQKTGDSQPDYLQHFIDYQTKYTARNDEFEVSNDDILSGVISFFLEGYETSSMVSSFLLYRLAMNPEIQEQLRKEVSKPETLSYDTLSEMELLEQCFKETNRLHSGLAALSKSCTTTTMIGGTKVEAGVTVILPMLAIHMDPQYWTDPEKFDPSRFSEAKKDSIKKGTYFPFGDGPRICIGYRLASAAVKTAVARIIRDFAVLPSPRTPKKFEQNPLHFIASQKGGLYLQFKKLPKLS